LITGSAASSAPTPATINGPLTCQQPGQRAPIAPYPDALSRVAVADPEDVVTRTAGTVQQRDLVHWKVLLDQLFAHPGGALE
jgi:hypothetical protein